MLQAIHHVETGGTVLSLMDEVYQAKLFVEHLASVSNDALHVVVGFGLFVAAAALMRRPLTDWRPWLTVFGLVMVNEIIDFAVERWPEWGSQYGEGTKDLVLTMALPTLLLFAARLHPPLFASERPSEGDGAC